MKLEEKLKSMDQEEFVYLGSKTNFFFIGKVKDAYKESQYASNDFYQKHMNITIPSTKRSLESAMADQRRILMCYSQNSEDEDYRKSLDAINTRVNALKEQLAYNLAYAENWVDLLDREVVDEYKRKWEKPLGKIILVDGIEMGAYWTYKEFQKGGYFRDNQSI